MVCLPKGLEVKMLSGTNGTRCHAWWTALASDKCDEFWLNLLVGCGLGFAASQKCQSPSLASLNQIANDWWLCSRLAAVVFCVWVEGSSTLSTSGTKRRWHINVREAGCWVCKIVERQWSLFRYPESTEASALSISSKEQQRVQLLLSMGENAVCFCHFWQISAHPGTRELSGIRHYDFLKTVQI